MAGARRLCRLALQTRNTKRRAYIPMPVMGAAAPVGAQSLVASGKFFGFQLAGDVVERAVVAAGCGVGGGADQFLHSRGMDDGPYRRSSCMAAYSGF